MKKVYVKYKILVNGLHTTTPYTIDEFVKFIKEEIKKR